MPHQFALPIADTVRQGDLPAVGAMESPTRDEQQFMKMLVAVCPKDAAGRTARLCLLRAIVAAHTNITIAPS